MPCVDNPRYTSALGLNCAQHKRLDCAKLGSVGYSPDQVKEILTNCPASCDVSACGEHGKNDGGYDYLPVQNRQDEDGQTIGSSSEKTANVTAMTRISRNLNEFGACFPGWDPTCRDDSSYLSPIGLSCSGFQTMGCDVFSEVGFTGEEVEELKSRCPCSCQWACPAPPSTTPPTSSPTIVPTFSPTSSPTRSPTPRPTNEPTFTPQPSVSFAPTHAPTPFSQLNRLPNKPIRASKRGVFGTPINQTNGSGMGFSILHLVIICVSFCAFVTFGIALYVSVKKNSKRMKENRRKRRNARRKRLREKKKEVRRKIATFKKNRRGLFAWNEEYSSQKRRGRKNTSTTYDRSKRRKNISQNHLECRGLALPTRTRQEYTQSRLSLDQDSFDSPVSSTVWQTHSSRGRPTRTTGRKNKERNIYKGAEFLKPVSRGGKEDLCMAVVEKVDGTLNAESHLVSSRSNRWMGASRSTDHSIEGGIRNNRRSNIPKLKRRLRPPQSRNQKRSQEDDDLSLSDDDLKNVNRNNRGASMLGNIAHDVAEAADDLMLIFD